MRAELEAPEREGGLAYGRTNGGYRDRAASAAAVAAFHALALFLLLAGFGPAPPAPADEPLRLIHVSDPPPPPPEQVVKLERLPEDGAPSPPSLLAQPAPILAPPPQVRLELPPPVLAAPLTGLGSDLSLGSAQLAGPGTGSGGDGAGSGSGAGGAGRGDGAGAAVRTRRIRGHFTNEDYPRSAEQAGAQGTAVARLSISADGRVADCRIRSSSGNRDLDDTTCRLILKRFRFTPARDVQGKPTTDLVEWEQSWSLRPEDRPDIAQATCRAEAAEAAADARRQRFAACMTALGWTR